MNTILRYIIRIRRKQILAGSIISLTVSVHEVQVSIYLVCNHCHMYIKMTHFGLQLILCCVVMSDDERAMCFLNAVIHALQLSGSEFCSVGGS